ncbi:4a-hydroxytetrahydrobiopterin dehydratase [Stieleria varia]|uniref:4a-hydroxytetrahydrobiopterin dehydratase n=1 Tax=Stieleria varia TaxID=2528005 RepID=A0A5C6B3W8_9BACT|nr:4a-hydroxytetrahydrobiopterin dehydratase [Stieleria varia]TWU05976.1 putative pterin-4-alpha-carbinolamine dehydratase [Stieleria varia]
MPEPANSSTTADRLCSKQCVPCEGGVPKLDRDSAQAYLQATPHWCLSEDTQRISRAINRKNFVQVIELVNRIADLAEQEQHHPDLHVTGYRNLAIDLTTHAISGLSENDFILAAKIDRLIDEEAP